MTARLTLNTLRYSAFLALMLSINLLDGALVHSSAASPRQSLIATAASLDVILVVSALYYWLLIRPGLRTRGSIAVVAVIALIHAVSFFPGAQTVRTALGALGETSLLVFIALRIRRARAARSEDPCDTIATALSGLFASPVARAITAEIAVLYYALFSWRAQPHVPPGATPLTIHKKAGQADLFAIFPFLSLLEILPVHVLVAHWSRTGAWIATALSIYGAIWLTGLARSFALRPVLAGPDLLRIRYGLLFNLSIPREAIAAIRPATAADQSSAIPRRTPARLALDLTEPLDAQGPLGLRRRMTSIAFTHDDQPAFLKALAEFTGSNRCPDRL